jgi:hypothetical protein
MPLVVKSYAQNDIDAVKAFNRRLLAHGDSYESIVFAEECTPKWLPSDGRRDTYNEYFLAIEDGIVRGAYALKHQPFCFQGQETRSVACFHHAVSEGLFIKRYANVGALLLKDALRRSPFLYTLGMDGVDKPLPRMLKALGWGLFPVPFYFRVVRPRSFLRNLQSLRSSRARRLLSDLAAATGVGGLAIKMAQAVTRQLGPRIGAYSVEEVPRFSDWCDEIWERSKSSYAWIAIRDKSTLDTFYPEGDDLFTRLRITAGGRLLGWAVIGERRTNPRFGSMRVGSILDALALPEDAPAVMHAATAALEAREVDLIVSNQSHYAWCEALKAAGFLSASSTFIFAASKELARNLAPLEHYRPLIYLNRSDGDGLPRNF